MKRLSKIFIALIMITAIIVPANIKEVDAYLVSRTGHKIYRVDAVMNRGGRWELYCNELTPVGFTWDDNGIPLGCISFTDSRGNLVSQVWNGNQKYFRFDDTIKKTGSAGKGTGGLYWTQYQFSGLKFWVTNSGNLIRELDNPIPY